MKNLKRLLLILMGVMAIFLVSCGDGPEDIAKRTVELVFTGNPYDQKDVEDMIKISGKDRDGAIRELEQSIVGSIASGLERQEILGLEGNVDDLIKTIKKLVVVKVSDTEKVGDSVFCKVQVKYPYINKGDIEDILLESIREIGDGMFNLSEKELEKKAEKFMKKGIQTVIKTIKTTKEIKTETATVELAKEKGEWKVQDIR